MTTSPGAEMITSLLASQPELAAQTRYAGKDNSLRGTIASALCTGLERTGTTSEQGLYQAIQGNIRYALTSEPTKWKDNNAIVGQPIEILLYGETIWKRARVLSRSESLGMVRLSLDAEFSET